MKSQTNWRLQSLTKDRIYQQESFILESKLLDSEKQSIQSRRSLIWKVVSFLWFDLTVAATRTIPSSLSFACCSAPLTESEERREEGTPMIKLAFALENHYHESYRMSSAHLLDRMPAQSRFLNIESTIITPQRQFTTPAPSFTTLAANDNGILFSRSSACGRVHGYSSLLYLDLLIHYYYYASPFTRPFARRGQASLRSLLYWLALQ